MYSNIYARIHQYERRWNYYDISTKSTKSFITLMYAFFKAGMSLLEWWNLFLSFIIKSYFYCGHYYYRIRSTLFPINTIYTYAIK